MDRGTLAALSDEWQQHSLLNLTTVVRNAGVESLRGKFQGQPVIIVAAGPSLNRTLDFLKNARGRALIIAVGTALKPLLHAGIEPNFVVAIDSDPKTWQQFSKICCDKQYLITSPIVYPPILRIFDGRIFSFTCNVLPEFNEWLTTFNFSPGDLQAGGTVATSSLDAAVLFGCSPIVLIGHDFLFFRRWHISCVAQYVPRSPIYSRTTCECTWK